MRSRRSFLSVTAAFSLLAGCAPSCRGSRDRPNPFHAAERCRQAALATKNLTPEDALRVWIEGCQDVPAIASCREAYAKAVRAPLDQLQSIWSQGCRDAYCPNLPEPRPRLCGPPKARPSTADLALGWAEFSLAVTMHDVNGSQVGVAEAVRYLADRAQGQGAPPPPVIPPRTDPLLEIRDEDHDRLRLTLFKPDGGTVRTWHTEAPPDAETLQDVVAVLGREAHGQRSLRIKTAPQVQFKSIKATLAALDGGYDVDFAVLREEPR
jgi:hypothetical protein